MTRCLVSLGSNEGDPDAHLDAAEQGLQRLAIQGTYVSSQRFTTPPIGGPSGQLPYRNAAAVFHTRFSAEELLKELQRLETNAVRVRTRRWDARSLDLDLLLYGDQVIDTPGLRVPHPRMTFRPFVLEPVCQVAADWIYPEGNVRLGSILRDLREGDDVLALSGEGEGAQMVRKLFAARKSPAFRLSERLSEDTNPKLTILAGDEPMASWPSGPRLALADCPREHWREEILAALECVWPSKPA